MKNYRTYINNVTLTVTDSLPKTLDKTQQLKVEDFDFLSFYKSLKKNNQKDFYLESSDPKAVFGLIKKKLTIIKAAGGLVANAKGEFLFIFRNKKWDLPKGKVEKGEKVKVTAVREVEEECGVKIEKREERLCKTYHIYELGNKIILKRTSWYKMTVKGSPKLIPQIAEGITTASWVAREGVSAKLKNTYPLILEVLKAGNLL